MNAVMKHLLCAALLSLPLPAVAQEGHHGDVHDTWQLLRPADCRPTEIRATGDDYDVKKDGRWVRGPVDNIVKVTAPDGPNVCVPPLDSENWGPDDVFYVVMPVEPGDSVADCGSSSDSTGRHPCAPST